MKIFESKNDQYEKLISGLIFTVILAICLVILCALINITFFSYSFTYIMIAVLCISFFVSGLKRVQEKNIGFLLKLGRRDFEENYAEGIWWIFPLWSFKQKPHFDLLNEAEEITIKIITNDEIPLDINIKYYWQLKNIKDLDNKYSSSFITDKLKHELGIFVRSNQAIELLSDQDISNKVLARFLISTGDRIGITISDVFPNINYEVQYLSVVRKYQEQYKDLQYQFDLMLKFQQIKKADMLLYENQILSCINNLGFTSSDAINFIKVYKNQVNMNDYSYSLNLNELNSLLDKVINNLKNRK